MIRNFANGSILVALLTTFIAGCASLPGGEVSDDEINEQAAKAYADVKAKSKISTNRDWTEKVQRVSRQIAQASGESFQWEAILIESPEVNAWCMPGGKIAVFTGIMPVLKTEGALAAVLGHEVAHATLRHGKQRYARAMKEQTLGVLVGGAAAIGGQLLCKTKECQLATQLGGVAAAFAITFYDRKFSREDESDADHVGQQYMAKAGYEPTEAIRLWERMGTATGGKAPPEWMSTHPSSSRRRENLAGWLPEAQQIYMQSPHRFGVGAAIR